MGSIERKKLVLFGAGKIGRSFIAQLFSRGGYEVVFVDISRTLIDELNRRKEYRVVIKGEKEQVLKINNVRGVILSDEKKVSDEVATAGIVATSVGLAGLAGVFPVLAKGILKRSKDPVHPVDIIIAENMRNADFYFREQLKTFLPPGFPIDSLVGLVETSIGKMVPIMTKKDIEEDMLQIFAEPYNTLILNRNGFKNPIPEIAGLAPKEHMKPWVDRKLFIHNLGHSSAAFAGHCFNPDFIYMHEVLAVPVIFEFTRCTMQQASAILLREYPDEFTPEDLNDHIDDLLERFRNKFLGDTVFRVGCDLPRKLGPEDRLAGAIKKAFEMKLPYESILFSLVCGSWFRAVDEDGNMLKNDISFAATRSRGIHHVLSDVCRFDKVRHKDIFDKALIFDSRLSNRKGDILSAFPTTMTK